MHSVKEKTAGFHELDKNDKFWLYGGTLVVRGTLVIIT